MTSPPMVVALPRLKTYLFVAMTLMTATPLVCLGVIEVDRWREAQRRDADKELTFTAEALSRSIGQAVDANVRALETSAGELEAHQSFDGPTLQRIVEVHRQRFPGLAVVNIAGSDGRTVASDPEFDAYRGSYIGRDYADREYYRQMIRTGRTGISEVEIGKVSGIPAIHAKTPIRWLQGPQAGQIAGNMGFALKLAHLQARTAEVVGTFEDLQARVIDTRMRVITESDPQGRAVLRDMSGLELYRAPPSAEVILRDGVDELGVPVRAALARISEQALNWTVAVTRPRASIEVRVDHARLTVLIALMATLLAGLLLAFGLSSWLARPIINLERYAARVRAGERPPHPVTTPWSPREVAGLMDTVESMVGQLQARNQELEALRLTLEERIRDRTAQLNQRTTEMRLLLDNLIEGVFTMDRRGVIGSEHSAVLDSWFGPPHADEPFHRYIGRHSEQFGQQAEVGWEQVIDDQLGVEVALGQLPTRAEVAGRHYNFSYRPIGDAAATDARFLVVVSDVTSHIERDKMLGEKKETLALFEHMLGDRPGLLAFIDDSARLIARVLTPGIADETLRRDLHTLKGNSLSFGVDSIGTLCHAIETAIADGGEGGRPDLVGLGERWARVSADVDRLLGERRWAIEMTADRYAEIERAGREGETPEVLLRLIQELTLDPVERRLRRFAKQAHAIAARLEKPIVVELAHDDLRLDDRVWSPFWGAFVHGLRNAIDHGIETAPIRLAAGKPAAGRITLRARRARTGITVEIEDDGRGIDWDALRRHGVDRGLPTETADDLVEVLFQDGISTALHVTALSGRGVGMSALRTAVTDLGGRIAVRSTKGVGTGISMTFPAA